MIIIYELIFIFNIYRAFTKSEEIIIQKNNDFWQIVAPPGTGKTTLAARIVRLGLKEKRKVYSNVPIRGAIKVDIKKDFGIKYLHDCKIIIDEAGSDLNNRNWQTNLSSGAIEFIQKHRHYNIDIYCFQQAPNTIDNKFRDLTTKIFLLNKSKLPFMIYAQCIEKVTKLSGGDSGDIVTYYEENKQNSFRFTMPPNWAYFNSFDRKMKLKEEKGKRYTIRDIV